MPPLTPRGSASSQPPSSRLAGSRLAACTFLGGFALALILGQLATQSTGGSPARTGVLRTCHKRTRAGLCVADVFGAIDDVYQDQWPGTVDLLVRSSVSGRFFLFETLFESIDQMWPKNVGDVILVLDAGEEEALSLVPSWVKVFFEKNALGLPKALVQQWSYGWADQYSTADYVAITDDDVIFNMKVTPPLLFNLTEGKPYVIGSKRSQRNVWLQSTEYFVGRGKYAANFMVQLPFVVPHGAFAAFRDHVAQTRPKQGDYNKAFKWFSQHAQDFGKHHIQHCALGNFIWNYMPDKVHVALEWSQHIPIPRVTAHIPWTTVFLSASEYKSDYPRYSALYVEVASRYAQEGLCLSFPEGELPGCAQFKGEQGQEVVWRYAFDWEDWPQLLFKRDGHGSHLYDKHIHEMHCLYKGLTRLAHGNLNRMIGTK